MVYGVMTDASCLNYFHCVRKRNKRRSRIKKGDLKRKYTFHDERVDQYEVNEGAKSFIHNVKTRGLKLIVGDCDAKLQAKILGSIMKKNGVSVYLAAGKKCSDTPDWYLSRSHDCNRCKSWFTKWNKEAATLMKTKKRKTMKSWKLTLERSCRDFPKANLRKLIDTQIKVMEEIDWKSDVFLFPGAYYLRIPCITSINRNFFDWYKYWHFPQNHLLSNTITEIQFQERH